MQRVIKIWVGGTAATAGDCKSPTLETPKVRVLPCPLNTHLGDVSRQ